MVEVKKRSYIRSDEPFHVEDLRIEKEIMSLEEDLEDSGKVVLRFSSGEYCSKAACKDRIRPVLVSLLLLRNRKRTPIPDVLIYCIAVFCLYL